jgi:peptidyl-prolyl cis-trans isomerase B (cyclophilin B)
MTRQPGLYATFETSEGNIVCRLFEKDAPKTVANFVDLAEGKREWTHPSTRKKSNDRLYDGTVLHRVIPDFMIQGGDPQGTGIGGPGYSIKGEFSSNGVTNDLKHTEGVISMARSMDPDSAGSQFFIMDADAPHLDGQYAAFGKVTSGIETVHEIANVNRDATDRPVEDQKIKKITVDTFGVEYKEPETIKEPESK